MRIAIDEQASAASAISPVVPPALLVLVVTSSAVVAQAPTPASAGAERFTGLWRGMIVDEPAELEVEVVVELGTGAGGGLAGTIDVPTSRLSYVPLEGVKVEGERIELRVSPALGGFR